MPPRAAIVAVIFDMDGVLVDSEPLWHLAEIEAFGAVGVALTTADCLQTTGLRVDAVVDHWFARHPWAGPPREAVAADIIARMVRLLGDHATAKDGAVEAVRFLRAQGLPLAVASSSPRVLIDAVVARLGLTDAFAVLRSAEHERYGKPHPAVYLATAAALGVDPRACVAIEDSGNGIRAAVAAGMYTIAVPDQAVAPEALALASVVLGSLRDLPTRWDEVVTRAAAGTTGSPAPRPPD
ncbi:MAG: hexitol phosphatase HxpB [Pseudomonadota bacterium]|nr:hexitol phosphatase HxpB [Pseudomonadota bacterium]